MKKILCLSGWAQNHDSLELFLQQSSLIKNNFQIDSFDYLSENSFAQLNKKIANYSPLDVIIGWSLGGQLALRFLASQAITTKYLILIAPPFQLVKDSRIISGITPTIKKRVFDLLENNADQMLKEFITLMALNDKNAKQLIKTININNHNLEQLKFWYQQLASFSCFDLDFSLIPDTLYFHGHGDMVVHISQKQYFENRIANFHQVLFTNCGHAPHLSHTNEMLDSIEKFIGISICNSK